MAPKLRQIPALAVAIMAGCSSTPKLNPVLEEVMSGIQEKVKGVPGSKEILPFNSSVARLKIIGEIDPNVSNIDCTSYTFAGPDGIIGLASVRCEASAGYEGYKQRSLGYNSPGPALKTWEIPEQATGTPLWEAAADQMGTDIASFLETQK